MEEKTLIQNGVIIDGTGTKPKKESILIDNCSIKATGKDADKLADSLMQVMTRMVTIQEEIIEALKAAKEAQTINIEMDGRTFTKDKS